MLFNTKLIASEILAEFFGNENIFFDKIEIDSRKLSNALNNNYVLFIAIKGSNHDGHSFVKELYKNGVRSFVVNKNFDYTQFPDAAFILHEDTIFALQQIAAIKRKKYKSKIIAITGSNGKTVVKEWLNHLLELKFRVCKSPKSYNSQIGVPLSLWLLDDYYNFAIIEAGISKPGEMEKLQKIILPEITVITNIGDAHQDNFADIVQKINEKITLAKDSHSIIFSADDEILCNQIQKLYKNKKLIKWSSKGENGDIFIKKIKHQTSQTEISISYNFGTTRITIPFTDKASVYNALTCFSVLFELDLHTDEKILKRFNNLPQISMRLQTIDGIKNSLIINDSYINDINSLEIALDYLNSKRNGRKTLLILSDFAGNVSNQDLPYNKVANLLKLKNISKFVGIGKQLSQRADIFAHESMFFESVDEFIRNLQNIDFSDYAILIKGSRNFRFERIITHLELKAHDTVLETDLGIIRKNLRYFRSLLNPNTSLMAVTKAYSYGSGFREIASLLQHEKINYLAVANIDEAIDLRNNGILLPIMVMSFLQKQTDLLFDYDIEPEVFSLKILQNLSTRAFYKKKTIKVHLKIDTGMHRLGLVEEDIYIAAEIICNNPYLKIGSVFTHLAASDKSSFDNFTELQIEIFNRIYNKIVYLTGIKPVRHVLNTAGIIRFPHYHFEMVRLGIGLYGYDSLINSKFTEPVSQLKSSILQIKKLKKGETVSYNRSGKVTRDSVIATVPIGYADGLDRRLGNGNWNFIVNGQKAPTIGDICMDLCMIDITGINAAEGDTVIVFGKENTVFEMAEKLNTIPYEIITGISQRVKRIYYEE